MRIAPPLAAPLSALLTLLVLAVFLLLPPVAALRVPPAWAGPVDWQEVPATAEGRQWWDAGSLRIDREGRLSVLSRFQPAPPAAAEGEEADRPAASLYVMQLDCDQILFRDVSVNGLPRFRSAWQAVADDELGAAVIREACAAWAERATS
jgi:hypothetical protein